MSTLAGCSGGGFDAPIDGEDVGTNAAAVINGKASDSTQDAVVLLVQYDRGATEMGACTGTLLAPNLVLTARHCVSRTDSDAECATDQSAARGKIYEDHAADSLYVFTGTKRPDFKTHVTPDGRGAKILHPTATALCGHDIALVQLAAPIPNAKIARIRLDGPPKGTETVTSVGWGVTSSQDEPTVRQQRPGVKIIQVGSTGQFVDVSPNEFAVGESICSGDSGGPALIEPTGAVVGVVSRGGNGKQPIKADPSATCVKSSNIYTQVAPFKDFIVDALHAVGQEPWLETDTTDARLVKPAACDAHTPCPTGYACEAAATGSVCRMKTGIVPASATATSTADSPASGGCNASGATSDGPTVIGLFWATVALGGVLRRRARKP